MTYIIRFLIEWIILEEKDGKAKVMANLLLDSQEYNPSNNTAKYTHNGGTGYSNNYGLSSIRKWLDETFYNTAFNSFQQELIDAKLLNNSASTTSSSTNIYGCGNTSDKIFLYAYSEAIEAPFSNEALRQATGTDYAKCQGLYVYNAGAYDGNSYWLLRSPDATNAYYCSHVHYDGTIKGGTVYYCAYGIRPVCYFYL